MTSSPKKRPPRRATPKRPIIGWREWLALPGLGIPKIKAKIDTGASSSTLHAFGIERRRAEGRDRVAFYTYPGQADSGNGVGCTAELLDIRDVRSSNGLVETRYYIEVMARLQGIEWPIALTLSDRSHMKFRMLLGREAISGHFLVDAAGSFLDATLVDDDEDSNGPEEAQ